MKAAVAAAVYTALLLSGSAHDAQTASVRPHASGEAFAPRASSLSTVGQRATSAGSPEQKPLHAAGRPASLLVRRAPPPRRAHALETKAASQLESHAKPAGRRQSAEATTFSKAALQKVAFSLLLASILVYLGSLIYFKVVERKGKLDLEEKARNSWASAVAETVTGVKAGKGASSLARPLSAAAQEFVASAGTGRLVRHLCELRMDRGLAAATKGGSAGRAGAAAPAAMALVLCSETDKDGCERPPFREKTRASDAGRRQQHATSGDAESGDAASQQLRGGGGEEAGGGGAKDDITSQVLSDPNEARSALGVGVVCRKARKRHAPNQDSFLVAQVAAVGDFRGTLAIYGVFDGHGSQGHLVSQFVREQLPLLFVRSPHLESDRERALLEAFSGTQELLERATQAGALNARFSGSTATLVCVDWSRSALTVAHVGDSRAVLVKRNGTHMDLTEDHRPESLSEKERIEKAGGEVRHDGHYNYRVYTPGERSPGLNMSRALGDLEAHRIGVSATPAVWTVGLERSKDLAVLVASDGVWEFLPSDESAKMVHSALDRSDDKPAGITTADQAQHAVEQLATKSWDSWMADSQGQESDDITAVLAPLH